MRQKRGKGKQKQVKPHVMVENEPDMNLGYTEADNNVPHDLHNMEYDSEVYNQALQTDSSMRQQQVSLEKLVNEIANNANYQEEYRLPHEDPQYNEEELNAALSVINEIMKLDAALPFNVPVDPDLLGIPDYCDIIDTPMDFGTIRKNLEDGIKYVNAEDVFQDVQLIWENCSMFNKRGDYVLDLMKWVKSQFMKFWAEAKLPLEPTQTSKGYSHLPPSRTRHGKECRDGSGANDSSCQLQNHMGQHQVLSGFPSSIYNQILQPSCPPTTNKRHSKQAQGVGQDSDISIHCHQEQEQNHQSLSNNNQRIFSLVASNTKHGKHGYAVDYAVGSDTDNSAHKLDDQVDHDQIQSHQSSLVYKDQFPTVSNVGHRKLEKRQPVGPGDQPQASLKQHNTCSSQPQPFSTSSQSQDPQQQPEVQNEITSTGKKRHSRVRGPTLCLNLWNREGKRIYVTTNESGEPVGDEVSKLISFLGTVARDGLTAPLIYADWRAVPEANKEKMWQQVQSRFEIGPICKDWVLKSIGKKWRDWKAKLKIAHYNTHATDEERIADRDERVSPEQWVALVSYWSSAEGEARSARNKANRLHEEEVKQPDGKVPSQSELFVSTRKRRDGQAVNEASTAVISQLEEHNTEQHDKSNCPKDQEEMFTEITAQDKHDHVITNGLDSSHSKSRGSKPTRAEALKMVSEANSEVREMKEKMAAMEKTCAQMATQMSAMMAMISSIQKSTDKQHSSIVEDTHEEQVQETRASKRSKTVQAPPPRNSVKRRSASRKK